MKSPRLMMGYAVFLVVCGAIAFFMAPAGQNAATALIVPSIAAALMVICAVMAARIHQNRTVGMIGIHAGLILPILFAVAFAFRSYNTFQSGGEAKRYLAIILAVMTVGSLIAFVAILKTRPSMANRV